MSKAMSLVSVIAACWLVGCVAQEPEPGAAARLGMINGTFDHDRTGVVFVSDSTMSQFCTGSLIAPRLVAMAALCSFDGAELVAVFGENVADGGGSTPVSEVVFHPDYDPEVLETTNLAVAVLEADAPEDAVPIPPLPAPMGLTEADEGASVTFVGYGLTSPTDFDAGVRRSAESPITERGRAPSTSPDWPCGAARTVASRPCCSSSSGSATSASSSS